MMNEEKPQQILIFFLMQEIMQFIEDYVSMILEAK